MPLPSPNGCDRRRTRDDMDPTITSTPADDVCEAATLDSIVIAGTRPGPSCPPCTLSHAEHGRVDGAFGIDIIDASIASTDGDGPDDFDATIDPANRTLATDEGAAAARWAAVVESWCDLLDRTTVSPSHRPPRRTARSYGWTAAPSAADAGSPSHDDDDLDPPSPAQIDESDSGGRYGTTRRCRRTPSPRWTGLVWTPAPGSIGTDDAPPPVGADHRGADCGDADQNAPALVGADEHAAR